MKDALTLLRDAYALLQDKTKWTTRVAARGPKGGTIQPTNPEATQWCAAGALYGVSGLPSVFSKEQPEQRAAVQEAFELLTEALDGNDTGAIAYTNDDPDQGYPVIMDAYRKAIADNTPIEVRPAKAVEETPLVEAR